MATKLKNLQITKVALVDEGSCSEAHIKLFKSKGGTQTMKFEEILKSLPEDQRAVVNAEIAKAKAELPEGAMSAEDAKKMEEAKKAAMDEVESLKKSKDGVDEEEVLKSMPPAARAILEKAKNQAAAAEAIAKRVLEEKEEAEFLAKSKEVPFIPEVDKKLVGLCKSIKGVDGAVDTVMELLKSANALISKGKSFDEIGGGAANEVGTGSADEAWAEIEKAASSLVVKGKVTQEQAIQSVIANQTELYKRYVNALRNE